MSSPQTLSLSSSIEAIAPPGSDLNIYSPVDLIGSLPCESIFLSCRSPDKPLAAEVAVLLNHLGVRYWFDRQDQDTERAATLGLVGDQALVYALDRGIRHSSKILGFLSSATCGSWWVPYEIGAARALGRSASYLVSASVQGIQALPGYARVATHYWSIDELIRWALSLRGRRVSATMGPIQEHLITEMERFMPRYPSILTVTDLSVRALIAIELLAKTETQQVLQITPTDRFDWLPGLSGLLRDLSYDLFVPLAFFQLNKHQLFEPERDLLRQVYQSITREREFAECPPKLIYEPSCWGWRQRRYQEPAKFWLQGLSPEQLEERLDHFFIVRNFSGNRRLATKEEFKAEFDRIQDSHDENERRSLGVLVNPLFGFTPETRPVYFRVLAFQQRLYQAIVNQRPRAISEETRPAVEYLEGKKTLSQLGWPVDQVQPPEAHNE